MMQEKNPHSSQMKRKRLTLIILLVVLATVAVGLYYLISPYVRRGIRRRVIVFYFQNVSEDNSLDPLTYGITLEIKDDLRAVKRAVTGRWSVAKKYLALKTIDEADTRFASVGMDVARALGCQYAVVGEVNRIGNEIEIKATTVNAHTGKRKIHKIARGQEEEIFRLIDDISVQVARSVGGYLTKTEEAEIRRPPTRSLEAFKHFCNGRIASINRRYSDAIRAYLQAITLDRDYLRAYVNLGYTYCYIGDYQRAVKAAQNAAEKHPEDTLGWSTLGYIHNEYEKYSEAEKAYLRGLAINPEDTTILNNIGVNYRDKYRNKKDKGNLDKAIEYFDRGLALDPYDSYLNFNKGGALYDKGLHEEAAKYYKAAYDMLPNYENAHNMRGCCLRKLRKYDEALKEFEEELKYYPDDVQAQYNIGLTYENKGDLVKAEKNCRKAINMNPYYYRAYYALGGLLNDQGKRAEAVEVYKQGIAIEPDYHHFYWALGASLMELGRLEESKKCWETYLKYDSTSEQAHWARVRLKQINAALAGKPPKTP
ncbi:MAG: hypothetical protein AMS15_05440 [Planctomycetes bacterium DG_23]|nr:MAG: hypothetical protein AMS15_05440 [Planctomycetes bacterium DG_23]